MNLLDSILLSVRDYTEEIDEEVFSPFSRCAAFKQFVLNVMGSLLRDDNYGVTSFVRSLGLSGDCYQNILHMFRSKAINIPLLRHAWIAAVKKHAPFFYAESEKNKENRCVTLVIDHKKNSKEARHMPLVHKMFQESDTQSKAEYIFGHCWGAVGVLIGNTADRLACLPLMIQIQDGLKGLMTWKECDIIDETMITRLYRNAIECAGQLKCNCRFLADRAFLSKEALKLIEKYNEASEYILHVVTKCRNNTIAFKEPVLQKGKRGRPPKRGERVKLNDLFETHRKDFKEEKMIIYGEEKSVRYLVIDLLWKQGYYKKLRFVLSVMDKTVKSILVTDDLSLTGKEVIEHYCFRYRVETMFRTMSQNGSFSYRFWTTAMSKLNRFAKSSDPDPLSKIKEQNKRVKILECINAIELYMLVCGMATGINQIISVTIDMDPQLMRWQRTPAKKRPSEENIMHAMKRVFSCVIRTGFVDGKYEILQIIHEAQKHKSRASLSEE